MYRVYSVDLTTPTGPNGTELVPSSQRISEIDILNFPTGASVEFALGATADFFTVADKFFAAPKGEDMQAGSLRYRNLVAQPGVVLQVLISFDAGQFNVAP